VAQISVGERDSYIEVLERHSGLRPSEKEFPEWRSSAFWHKNTPDNTDALATSVHSRTMNRHGTEQRRECTFKP
jgi:hypothetical protein